MGAGCENMEYRKKPVVIDAEQFFLKDWLGKPTDKKGRWTNGVYIEIQIDSSTKLFIDTLEGRHEVTDGDWIIKGIKGEKYPCKPDIFNLTYEKV